MNQSNYVYCGLAQEWPAKEPERKTAVLLGVSTHVHMSVCHQWGMCKVMRCTYSALGLTTQGTVCLSCLGKSTFLAPY